MPKIRREHPPEAAFYGPKSICHCGHTGDSMETQHHDRYSYGHGACKVKDCDCKQFTWKKWTTEYLAAKLHR